MNDEFVGLIYQTSPLHDIGKVAIPDRILLKPGRLTAEEFEIMKTHTTHGAATLEAALEKYPGTPFLKMAHDIALGHHEKYDGQGLSPRASRRRHPACRPHHGLGRRLRRVDVTAGLQGGVQPRAVQVDDHGGRRQTLRPGHSGSISYPGRAVHRHPPQYAETVNRDFSQAAPRRPRPQPTETRWTEKCSASQPWRQLHDPELRECPDRVDC